MSLGDISGRAKTNIRDPAGQAICDFCGFSYNHRNLVKQFQWAGAALVDTGYLVCSSCVDTPFEQNRVLILPPDPLPLINPRADFNTTAPYPATTPGNQGFSQYVLGAPTPGLYPTTKSAVLAQVASLSGIPTPSPVYDQSTTIAPANTSVQLLWPNPNRSWLLLYNPVTAQAQLSMSIAMWGVTTNLILGPGEAYFWATAQGFGPVYTGALFLIGLTTPMPFWAWESPAEPYLTDENGNYILTEDGQRIELG